jgi:hypothetical protein
VDPEAGFTEDLRNAMVLDFARREDGQYWAATSRGLFRFTEEGRQTSHIAHEPGNPDSLSDEAVRSLLPAGENGLWIGTDGGGLYRLDGPSGGLTHYHHEAGRPDSISGNHITALLGGSDGFLWVGTRSNGLNQCRIENWSCRRFTGGAEDPSGLELSHFQVTSLFRDRDGQVWVGTGSGGLNQVLLGPRGAVNGFRHWTSQDGLLDDSIMAIEQDLDDSLWLTTRHGLSRLLPGTGQVINYVPQSGLPARLFNAGASAADSRFIYFGSVEGLLSFPKGSRFAQRQAADVQIAAIERAPPGKPSQTVYWGAEELAIPYGEVLSIKLAVLDLSESTHDYAYRLDAQDPWIGMGQQRQLILHGLAPGQYFLQARGRDVFGSWGESETLRLEVVPPYWKTTWFRAFLALLLLVGALGVNQR